MDNPNELRFTDPLGQAPGRFCNLINIGHTAEFFALDFRSVTPEGEACLLGRYFLTPQHAKRLLRTLMDHVAGFEEEMGEIKESEPMAGPPDAN